MPGTILGTLCLFPFVFTSLWGWYFMLPVLQVSKLRVTQSHKANSQTSSSEGIHAIKRSLTAICSHGPLPCPIVTHQVLLYLIIYICLTLQVHPSACTCTRTHSCEQHESSEVSVWLSPDPSPSLSSPLSPSSSSSPHSLLLTHWSSQHSYQVDTISILTWQMGRLRHRRS